MTDNKEMAGKSKQAPRGAKKTFGALGRNKTNPNPVDTKMKQETRLAENQKYLKQANVKAFLSAISAAEGGDYNLKYGGIKGKSLFR